MKEKQELVPFDEEQFAAWQHQICCGIIQRIIEETPHMPEDDKGYVYYYDRSLGQVFLVNPELEPLMPPLFPSLGTVQVRLGTVDEITETYEPSPHYLATK